MDAAAPPAACRFALLRSRLNALRVMQNCCCRACNRLNAVTNNDACCQQHTVYLDNRFRRRCMNAAVRTIYCRLTPLPRNNARCMLLRRLHHMLDCCKQRACNVSCRLLCANRAT